MQEQHRGGPSSYQYMPVRCQTVTKQRNATAISMQHLLHRGNTSRTSRQARDAHFAMRTARSATRRPRATLASTTPWTRAQPPGHVRAYRPCRAPRALCTSPRASRCPCEDAPTRAARAMRHARMCLRCVAGALPTHERCASRARVANGAPGTPNFKFPWWRLPSLRSQSSPRPCAMAIHDQIHPCSEAVRAPPATSRGARSPWPRSSSRRRRRARPRSAPRLPRASPWPGGGSAAAPCGSPAPPRRSRRARLARCAGDPPHAHTSQATADHRLRRTRGLRRRQRLRPRAPATGDPFRSATAAPWAPTHPISRKVRQL